MSTTEHASTLAHADRRLSIRLASGCDDLKAVQRLRAQVFLEELAGREPDQFGILDQDDYDQLCDHLLVTDETCDGPQVVGTYRLLRESVALRTSGFYSAGEFDIGMLVKGSCRPSGELLELGRSCVLPAYRNSATISLLWRGIAEYINCHRIGLMFGCASFAGVDPDAHAAGLSYLYHNHLAEAHLRPSAIPATGVHLEQLKRGTYDERRALLSLPPLVKGYLRAGAKVGEGAFIDHSFNTIDVCVVLPVERISERYANRFSTAA